MVPGLLLLYFHPWLLLGVAIDLMLVWSVLVANWTPERIAGGPERTRSGGRHPLLQPCRLCEFR
jgi:hypothetical protein